LQDFLSRNLNETIDAKKKREQQLKAREDEKFEKLFQPKISKGS